MSWSEKGAPSMHPVMMRALKAPCVQRCPGAPGAVGHLPSGDETGLWRGRELRPPDAVPLGCWAFTSAEDASTNNTSSVEEREGQTCCIISQN